MSFQIPNEIHSVGRQLKTPRIQRVRESGVAGIEDFDLFQNGSRSKPVHAVEGNWMRVSVGEIQVDGER